MMRPAFALSALALLAACASPARFDLGGGIDDVSVPVAAPVPVQPAEVRLVAAIEAEGCMLNASNVGDVLVRANLTQAELTQITPTLASAGRLEVAGDGEIRVLTERCV